MHLIDLYPGLTVFQSSYAGWRLNSGILAAGDGVVLIDPGVLPDEIAEIRAAVGGRPVHYVVHSHHHSDHSFGLSAWAGAPRIAHRLYQAFEESALQVEAFAGTISERQGIQWEPPVRYLPPTRAVEGPQPLDEMLLPGWEIIPAPGHSPDLITLYHAESRTLWSSDIVADLQDIPTLWDGSPQEALDTLANLSRMAIDVLVPGHGTPATTPEQVAAYFEANRAYLLDLQALVRYMQQAHRSLDDAVVEGLKAAPDATWKLACEVNVKRAWSEALRLAAAPVAD